MKKILFLHAGSEMYGADKVMFDLIKNIDKSQYIPYVILPEEGILNSRLKEINVKVDVVPYPVLRRKYFNIKGVLQYIIEYFKYSRQLVKLAKEEKVDIIHNNTSAVLEGCYVSKKLNIPLVWVVHEIIVNPKFVFKIICKIIAHYSTKVIVVSDAVKKHLLGSGYFKKNTVKVIYNGVDSKRFNPEVKCDCLYNEWSIPNTSKIVGMIGRVNSWKGQEDFLLATNKVLENNKNVYAIIVGGVFVGEEKYKNILLENINKSPFKDRIIYSDYRNDTEAIHKLFDIFVLPSINPDPLPTVVLEAMATGKPIVGYAHGGVCEMVKDGVNGLLVEPRNSDLLADAIDKLLQNGKLCKQMGKKSLEKFNNNFSMTRYVNNYSKEYAEIIKKYNKQK